MKYSVTVERSLYEERELVVEAASAEDAKQIAWRTLDTIDPDDLPRHHLSVYGINLEASPIEGDPS